jgi:S1-C subfamily serine protease
LVGVVFAVLYNKYSRITEETRLAKEKEEKAKKAEAKIQQAKEKARLAAAKAKRDEEARKNREPTVFTGEEIYQRTLHSTAYVAVRRNTGARGNGSGSLVDRKRRLVLTAYHVVDKAAEVKVMFPQYEDGEVISDRDYYNGRLASLLIPGKVIASNSQCDLALIQLDSIPQGVMELPLAKRSPLRGSHVHTVGNPATSAGLWAYTFGAVRQVAPKRYTFVENKQTIDAYVVETQNPINKGDSGGPVVNDRIELVAVNSGATPNIRDGTICIDIREVKALLVSVPR